MFDIDKVFDAFSSSEYGSAVNGDLISRRIQDLPLSTQKLLAWASLSSGTISFNIIRKLLDPKENPDDSSELPLLRKADEALPALNGALGAYILMPAEDEDKFRFSHDRYLAAVYEMTDKQWNTKRMHYIIAKMLASGAIFHDDTTAGTKGLYTRARHICLAVDLIKLKETERYVFRETLYQAAETACESGAKSTGIFYYAHCLLLLQDEPWDDTKTDVSYQETLQLFMRAAEAYWHQQLYDEALALIRTVFKRAKAVEDMAGAFVLQSRVFAMRGDSFGAFQSLKDCLYVTFNLPLRSLRSISIILRA